MPIIQGLIAEGNQLKGEYGGNEKLREAIMDKILPKLPKNNHKRTLTQKDLEFHYKYSGSYVFFCVANGDTPKRVCWAFVDELENEFLRLNNPNNATRVKSIIKDKMNFWNDPNNDKISNLRNKVDEVKDVMIDNIEKVLDRGEKLDHLTQATEDIEASAQFFQRGTRKLKNNMIMRYVVLVIILIFLVVAVLIVLALIIMFAACGITFERCGGK